MKPSGSNVLAVKSCFLILQYIFSYCKGSLIRRKRTASWFINNGGKKNIKRSPFYVIICEQYIEYHNIKYLDAIL